MDFSLESCSFYFLFFLRLTYNISLHVLGILGSTVVNYIRLKQIKNSIKETGNTLIEKTNELTDLVKAQDNQIGTRATELKDSFSSQSKLLEQKLEELGSALNFFILNLASEPLKEFGIHIQPPGITKSFESGQSAAVSQYHGDIKDLIDTILSRINSLIEVMNINQLKMQGDLKTLQLNLEKIDTSVLQNEERTVMELNKLAKFLKSQSIPVSGLTEAIPNEYLENNQWWTKTSTFASIICTVLTGTVLVYEIFK